MVKTVMERDSDLLCQYNLVGMPQYSQYYIFIPGWTWIYSRQLTTILAMQMGIFM